MKAALLLILIFSLASPAFAEVSELNTPTLSSDSLKARVLRQLGLKKSELETDLCTEKVLPHASSQTVMVLTKTVVEEEVEYFVNTTIAVVNNQTGKVLQKYDEAYYLYANTVYISSITIDTAPYMLTKDIRAFGIRVTYNGRSRANPNDDSVLSLYIQEGASLRKVLTDVTVNYYTAEREVYCEGKYTIIESVVLIDNSASSNGYYNIIVKEKRINGTDTEASSTAGEERNCVTVSSEEFQKTSTYFYNGKSYN